MNENGCLRKTKYRTGNRNESRLNPAVTTPNENRKSFSQPHKTDITTTKFKTSIEATTTPITIHNLNRLYTTTSVSSVPPPTGITTIFTTPLLPQTKPPPTTLITKITVPPTPTTPTTPTTIKHVTTTSNPSFKLKPPSKKLILCFFFPLLSVIISSSDLPNVIITGRSDVRLLINGTLCTSTLISDHHATHIRLLITHHNVTFTLDLELNTVLLSSSFVERVISQNSSYDRHSNQSKEFCYYLGSVRGEDDTSAAFSSCPTLRGFFRVRNDTWHVEALEDGTYQVSMETYNKLASWFCGIKDLRDEVDYLRAHQGDSKRTRRSIVDGSLEDMLVVELYLANDVTRFQKYRGYDGVFSSSKEIANVANMLYQPLGIVVVLVGVEVWTDRDKFAVSKDSSVTLKNWMVYRSSQVDIYNDVGYLISRTKFDGSTLGLAHINTICSSGESGGIIQSIDDRPDVSGAILAHEIGHNFGITHDSQDCICESEMVDCIMSSRASTRVGGKYFSSCSKEQMRTSLGKGSDICLHNTPHTLNRYLAVCGNGILEDGEDCDCGRQAAHMCNQKCCEPSTCRLKGKSQCAQGGCCDVDSCSFRRQGHVCRAEAPGACDLPEFCDGRSSLCPNDVFVHDGTQCSAHNKEGSCFEGACPNRESQCKILYGDGASDGIKDCYLFNTKGDVHGYCAYNLKFTPESTHDYFPCSTQDMFCGSVQCHSPSLGFAKYQKFISRSSKTSRGTNCYSVTMDYGKQVPSPGLAPDGSPCGTNSICVNKKCVSTRTVLAKSPCPKCVNGKCNSRGHCHCFQGSGGLTCEEPGPGGSVDSGKMRPEGSKATGLIVGLLIFFLVLIILIALFVYDYKHNQHSIKFFKSLADKSRSGPPPGSLSSKPPQAPRKAFDNNNNIKEGHDNAIFSISVIPTRVAPNPSKVTPAPQRYQKDFNNNYNPKQRRGFDNAALICEELNPSHLVTSNPVKPPNSKAPTKPPGGNPKKPSALPPAPPILNRPSNNQHTTNQPKLPQKPSSQQKNKPERPANPPKTRNNVNDVVSKFNELDNNTRFKNRKI